MPLFPRRHSAYSIFRNGNRNLFILQTQFVARLFAITTVHTYVEVKIRKALLTPFRADLSLTWMSIFFSRLAVQLLVRGRVPWEWATEQWLFIYSGDKHVDCVFPGSWPDVPSFCQEFFEFFTNFRYLCMLLVLPCSWASFMTTLHHRITSRREFFTAGFLPCSRPSAG